MQCKPLLALLVKPVWQRHWAIKDVAIAASLADALEGVYRFRFLSYQMVPFAVLRYFPYNDFILIEKPFLK